MIGYYNKAVIQKTVYRDVAQVVERYFREVEAASSSLVIPINLKTKQKADRVLICLVFCCLEIGIAVFVFINSGCNTKIRCEG